MRDLIDLAQHLETQAKAEAKAGADTTDVTIALHLAARATHALEMLARVVPPALPADLVTLLLTRRSRWDDVRDVLTGRAHVHPYAGDPPEQPHADVDSSGGEVSKGGTK